MSSNMNVTNIYGDQFSMTDFLNLSNMDKKSLEGIGSYYPKSYKNIPEISSQMVQDWFSDLCPNGIDKEIKSIQDAGFRIQISDTGNGVRKIFIYKKGKDPKKDIPLRARATQIVEAFRQAIKMYTETLGKGKPFVFKEWYGKDKPYTNYINGSYHVHTKVDHALYNCWMTINMKKEGDIYKVKYKNIPSKI